MPYTQQTAGVVAALAKTRRRVLAEQLALCGTCTGQRRVLNPNNGNVEKCPACAGAGVR